MDQNCTWITWSNFVTIWSDSSPSPCHRVYYVILQLSACFSDSSIANLGTGTSAKLC